MTTAFIIIDLQNDYFPGGKFPLYNPKDATATASRLLLVVRERPDFKVIHVRHEEETAEAPFFVKGSEGAEIHPQVAPVDGESVVVKHYPNSFIDTNLQSLLNANKILNVVLVGAMADMCVLGTARAASELGFDVTVISDAVASRKLEHGGRVVEAKDVLTAVFATLSDDYAKVKTADEFEKSLPKVA